MKMYLFKLTGETKNWGTLKIEDKIISLFMLLSFLPIIMIGICGIGFVPVVFDFISMLCFWFFVLCVWISIIVHLIYSYISHKLKH